MFLNEIERSAKNGYPKMKKNPLRTTIRLFAQGQSRPGLGRKNENIKKTKSRISGSILHRGAAAVFFLCVVVTISWAINPTFPTSQNNTAFGVNGQGSPARGGNGHAYANENCMPNDYTITTGSGIIVPGIIDTGNHCDDCITPMILPFPVTFYDETFFSVGIWSNGHLQFTGTNAQDFNNECLPTANLTDLIAPYWDDLYTGDIATSQGVFTSVTGTAPNRVFNIEWRANFCCGTGVVLNFEVRLHEDTPNFEIIYGRLEDCETTGCQGSGATVGAQRDTGSHFTQFECDMGGLMDGLQLSFVYASGCASPTPTPTATAAFTPTPTATATFTPAPTPTATATATATATSTPTPTSTISPTTLTVAPASGTYGGTVNLSATLTSTGSGVGNKTVDFTLNGNAVGSATTNGSGVATKTGVSLSGIYPGIYPSGVGATFAGDSSYSASSGTATLTVGYGTCSGQDPGGVILQPINSDGSSVFQHNSTVPVKFKVCDANGNSVSDNTAVFATGYGSVTMINTVRGTVNNVNEQTYNDIPDSAFHNGNGLWIFNMAIKNLTAGNTYQFRIALKDGSFIYFTIGVK
jgi:hypothetical protein